MAILFDLDGTLVDTAFDIIQAVNALCLELEQPYPDPILLKNNTTFGLNKLLEIALNCNLHNINAEKLQQLRFRFRELYNQTKFTNSKLFPGILELLNNLKQYQFKMAIVTNKHMEFAAPILNQLDVAHYFDSIITADMVAKPKPAPDGLLLAMQQLNAIPQECVFIGDGEQDIIAGNAAKVKTVVALFGYIGENVLPRTWNSNYFAEKPEDLWGLIKKLYL